MDLKKAAIFSLSCLTLMCTCLGEARSWNEIKASGQLIIGNATEEYAPFTYLQNGQLSGWEYEMTNAVASRMGLKPVWKRATFASLPVRLKGGEFDILASSLNNTEERRKIIDFPSVPEYCSGNVYVSSATKPVDRNGVNGKTLAVESDTIQEQDAQSTPGVRQIRSFSTDNGAIYSVLLGRSDALVSDSIVAQSTLKRFPKILTMGKAYNLSSVYYGLPKGNSDLKSAVDNALKSLIADGTYAKISSRYFSQSILCK